MPPSPPWLIIAYSDKDLKYIIFAGFLSKIWICLYSIGFSCDILLAQLKLDVVKKSVIIELDLGLYGSI